MSKSQTLRALVNERLAAAAEEIFVLIERTISEYEEELCRSKEENQRKQQLHSRVELVRGNVQNPSVSPGPGLNQEVIKEEPEEQSVKQEEEQLPVSVPEYISVCVKTEESTQEEDVSSEPRFHSETHEGHTEHSSDTDNDDDWGPLTQMETEADGDQHNQSEAAPETTVHIMSGEEGKKHPCPFCQRRFDTKQHLQNHVRVHTGEKPFSCSFCQKTFNHKGHLNTHERTHTGERPYSCPTCEKTFAHKTTLDAHVRTHTGEKPYSCSSCEKTFVHRGDLNKHKRKHTGAKPYSCTICEKTFSQKSYLDSHVRTHTGEKPYSCSYCEKQFSDPSSLRLHRRTHTGEKPYVCLICQKTFVRKDHLEVHTRTHTGEKPYSCPVCDAAFAQKSHLNAHMRTHSVKPLPAD